MIDTPIYLEEKKLKNCRNTHSSKCIIIIAPQTKRRKKECDDAVSGAKFIARA
jgi:hypothetical protein